MTQEAIQITETPPLPGLKLVQDTNKALDTIATDFAGSADPAALAGPYMTWADTGNMLLKRRNAADTEWVTIGPLLAELQPRNENLDALSEIVGAAGTFPAFTDEGEMRTAEIVGTVSWSGGPTGGIIELGGNSNGIYIKLADGTMISWANVPVGADPGATSWSWIYPVAYVGAPSVMINGIAGNSGSQRTAAESISSSSISGFVHNSGTGIIVNIRCLAIGSWR